jgi:hypothetical protein
MRHAAMVGGCFMEAGYGGLPYAIKSASPLRNSREV